MQKWTLNVIDTPVRKKKGNVSRVEEKHEKSRVANIVIKYIKKSFPVNTVLPSDYTSQTTLLSRECFLLHYGGQL